MEPGIHGVRTHWIGGFMAFLLGLAHSRGLAHSPGSARSWGPDLTV
jgi:hypothetical protein